jgi:subtilisin family serine protease
MNRPGYVVMTLRTGESLGHVPAQLDILSGAARYANQLDRGGRLDATLSRWGEGVRAAAVFHAAKSLGNTGEHHVGYNKIEEELGLSRTYKMQIARPDRTHDVVEALRDLPQVESAMVQMLATAPFAVAASAEPKLSEAWEPHQRVNATEARNLEPGDERVTIGIVDTGIVVGHPEFQRKCLAGYDTVDLGIGSLNDQMRLVGDSRGHDYNPYDDVGHGCHVGGIIGAQGWRIPPGVAGACLMLPLRVLAAAIGRNGTRRIGVGSLTDIDCGLKVCVDLGGTVCNLSFGTPASSIDPHAPIPHQSVVRYAAHYGCTLIAAAGNSGVEEEFYPACLPEVIAVGSVDRHNRRSRFSTWGKHIALCAPGEDIVSVGREGYQKNSGTSFAAPFVTAVAALLVSRARRLRRELNGLEVKRLLIESASILGGGFNSETGHGLLNAVTAIRALDSSIRGNA